MKKTTLKLFTAFLLAAGACTSTISKADEPAFDKGDNTIGISMGVGVNYGYYADAVSVPAITLLYDHGSFSEVGPGTIGIGGIVGFKTSHYNYPASYGDYEARWTNYIIAARGTYHLTLLKDKNNHFDPYAGVVIGVRINNYTDTYNDYYYNTYHTHYRSDVSNANPVGGVFVGAKYNFTKAFGAFAELGYDISILRVGLNFNF